MHFGHSHANFVIFYYFILLMSSPKNQKFKNRRICIRFVISTSFQKIKIKNYAFNIFQPLTHPFYNS
jgi:hypothetical protein